MFSTTQSTSVMSIGAITSPDSAKTGYQLPSLCEMTNNAATAAAAAAAAVDSSREKQSYVGHWIHNNNATNASSDRYPTYPMMRTPSSSSLSNRSRFPSISMPSPSFSSSSSNASEHDEEDEAHHHHRRLSHPYQHSRQNSLFSNFDSTFGSSGSSSIGRSRSLGNKPDALATRRARNKLASAKYRAKKQALTHAMQDRIMQLATQVMNLREELTVTKKSEIEFKARYERLMQYHNTVQVSPPTASSATTTTTTRLY